MAVRLSGLLCLSVRADTKAFLRFPKVKKLRKCPHSRKTGNRYLCLCRLLFPPKPVLLCSCSTDDWNPMFQCTRKIKSLSTQRLEFVNEDHLIENESVLRCGKEFRSTCTRKGTAYLKPLKQKQCSSKSSASTLTEQSVIISLGNVVAKILEHTENKAMREHCRSEWKLVGALVDRILLTILFIADLVTTVYIYSVAPNVN